MVIGGAPIVDGTLMPGPVGMDMLGEGSGRLLVKPNELLMMLSIRLQ